MLDERFESDLVKALFGFDAIVGNYASPYAAGSAYVMLHHAFGEVNGKKGVWGHAIGGMGAITQAMARGARAWRRDRHRRRRARGDRRARPRRRRRPRQWRDASARNMSPPTSIRNCSTRGWCRRTRCRRRSSIASRNWRNGSGTFRMNVALSALPSFTALPGDGDHLTAGIILAPSLRYMDRAWHDAREHGWSREPVVEVLIPSTLDDTLAPTGPACREPVLPACRAAIADGKSWDDHRDEVADLMIATVDHYAPGFAASVIGRQILSPLDLEREFGLLGGDIFHGALTLNQLFSARPMLGHADYRGPLKGLYHCGSGAHPGGGVTGAPGHNAARVILRDHRALFG